MIRLKVKSVSQSSAVQFGEEPEGEIGINDGNHHFYESVYSVIAQSYRINSGFRLGTIPIANQRWHDIRP